jgi:hypothetical protein
MMGDNDQTNAIRVIVRELRMAPAQAAEVVDLFTRRDYADVLIHHHGTRAVQVASVIARARRRAGQSYGRHPEDDAVASLPNPSTAGEDD